MEYVCRIPADSSTTGQSRVTAQQGHDAVNNTSTANVASSTGKHKRWVSQTILFIYSVKFASLSAR